MLNNNKSNTHKKLETIASSIVKHYTVTMNNLCITIDWELWGKVMERS